CGIETPRAVPVRIPKRDIPATALELPFRLSSSIICSRLTAECRSERVDTALFKEFQDSSILDISPLSRTLPCPRPRRLISVILRNWVRKGIRRYLFGV